MHKGILLRLEVLHRLHPTRGKCTWISARIHPLDLFRSPRGNRKRRCPIFALCKRSSHTCVRAMLSELNFVWEPFKMSWPSGYFTKEEGLCICLWARRLVHMCAHTRHRDRGDPNEFFAGTLPCGSLPIKFSFRFPSTAFDVPRHASPSRRPSIGELNRGTLFLLGTSTLVQFGLRWF